MRIVALPPGGLDLILELGLGKELTGRTGEVARFADPPEPAPPLLSGAPPHDHLARYVLDREALTAAAPEVILTEEVCPVCLATCRRLADGAVAGVATLDGKDVPVVSLTARRLEDALAPILPVATLLRHQDRGERLLHVRSARLLALSMHVARYLVRVGGSRPTVALVSVAPDGTLTALGRWYPDLLDAAGGVPRLATPGGDDLPVTPATLRAAALDLLIVGTEGADALQRATASAETLTGVARSRWALNLDGLFARPAPHLVDAVEILLRMVFPAALGANGTPPPPDRALPL